MFTSEIEVEELQPEVWDVLSLLATRPVEVIEEEIEKVNVMADEATDALGDMAIKHPMLAQLMRGPSGPEVPFDERKNVALLNDAFYGALDDELSLPEFRAKMDMLWQLATIGVEIFKNPRIKKESQTLPDDQMTIINALKNAITRFKTGAETMRKYLANQDKAVLTSGYEVCYACMREIHEIQHKAYAKAREIDASYEAGSVSEEVTLARQTDSCAVFSRD